VVGGGPHPEKGSWGPPPALAEALLGAERVVVIWGERIGREQGATEGLLDVAAALNLVSVEGAGLLEVPELANARGLREAGCLPDAGPGLTETKDASTRKYAVNASFVGKGTEEIRDGLIAGEIESLVLFGVDPLRDFPDTPAWQEALAAANHIVCFSTFETATSKAADVVFPLETHAEKDGTVTHPDGRLQRVRPSAGRPGDIRPNWGILAELSLELGLDTGITSQPSAFQALTEAAPIYSGLTDAEIGGRGIRWQDRPAASLRPTVNDQDDAGAPSERFAVSAPAPSSDGPASPGRSPSEEGVPASSSFKLGTYRDLWAGAITELNPPLRFLAPQQRVELSVADAESLDLKIGDEVQVAQNSSSVRAKVDVKERIAEGTVFLIEGTKDANANGLLNGGPVSVTIEKVGE
jgi:NADH-quinone oxidoreductase subunit G